MWLRTFATALAIGSAVRKVQRPEDGPANDTAGLPVSIVQSEHIETEVGAKTGQAKVVAFGDSYSSGAGIHTAHSAYEGGSCYRDLETVPGAKYAAKHGMTFINKACGGAVIEYMPQYFDILASENPQDAENGWEGSLFTVTAGGNDLKTHRGETWMTLVIRCVGDLDDCSRSSANDVANFDEVQADLTDLYSRLAQFASKAKIRVFGYPRLLQYGWGPCWGVPGLGSREAGWLDTVTDMFNGHIYDAIQAVKLANPHVDIEYASVVRFVTKGACDFWNREINPIVVSGSEGTFSPATLHPTQAGYDQMLKALEASLT